MYFDPKFTSKGGWGGKKEPWQPPFKVVSEEERSEGGVVFSNLSVSLILPNIPIPILTYVHIVYKRMCRLSNLPDPGFLFPHTSLVGRSRLLLLLALKEVLLF